MYGYIYETTCTVTGKKYIGMHKWDKPTIDTNYFGSGKILKQALKKYGKDNFTCVILKWCETREELLESEKYFISEVQAPINENYYNVEDGGQGGHCEFYYQPVTLKQLQTLDYGRHLPASSLQKKQLSERRTGIDVSDETREKLRQNQLGKRCINNGKINKYVHSNQLNSYLNDGWQLGQIAKDRTDRINKFKSTMNEKDKTIWKQHLSDAFKDRRWVTNGLVNKQIKTEEIDDYLSKGFYFGRTKLTKRFND